MTIALTEVHDSAVCTCVTCWLILWCNEFWYGIEAVIVVTLEGCCLLDAALCNLVDMYQHFRGTWCLCLYDRWRWRQQAALKNGNKLHCVICQRTVFFELQCVIKFVCSGFWNHMLQVFCWDTAFSLLQRTLMHVVISFEVWK